jgi:hypothetical protein
MPQAESYKTVQGAKTPGAARASMAGHPAIQDQQTTPGREHLVNAAALKTMG